MESLCALNLTSLLFPKTYSELCKQSLSFLLSGSVSYVLGFMLCQVTAYQQPQHTAPNLPYSLSLSAAFPSPFRGPRAHSPSITTFLFPPPKCPLLDLLLPSTISVVASECLCLCTNMTPNWNSFKRNETVKSAKFLQLKFSEVQLHFRE